MATFFDEIRAIALSNKPRAEKVKNLQKKGLTATQARTQIENIIFVELQRTGVAVAEKQGAARFTIGVEIECFGFDKAYVQTRLGRAGIKSIVTGYSHQDSKDTYKLGHDGSISGANPCEVVSPVLKNLGSLRKVCKVINEAGAQVNKSCGLHVHFGAAGFTPAQWVRIISNYAAIEGVIDSFMPMSRRADNNYYCRSIAAAAERVQHLCDTPSMSDIQTAFRHDRYHKLNVMAFNSHNTIEFRQHSGTTDFKKIENWIKFLTAFLQWSLSHETMMAAKSISDLPFLTNAQKKYYNKRQEELNNR